MIPKDKWKWFGNAGHFCGSGDCRFHLTTLVGKYIISTIGEWRPMGATKDKEIGISGFYETMVFVHAGNCECGCGLPMMNCSEIDGLRYNKPKAATAGHNKICLKYSKL